MDRTSRLEAHGRVNQSTFLQANNHSVVRSYFFKPLPCENNSDPSSSLPDNPDESMTVSNIDQSQGQSCSNNSSLNIHEPTCISVSNLNGDNDHIDLKWSPSSSVG